MIFSVTEAKGWRRCRRKAYAGSFNGLAKTPVSSKPALRMGSIWHKGSEWWMDPSADDYPHDQIDETTVGSLQEPPFYVLMRLAADQQYKTIEAAVQEVLSRDLNSEEQYALMTERDMLEAMAMNYQHVWGSPLPDGFKAIKAEQTIVVDIPDTEHWECNTCGTINIGAYTGGAGRAESASCVSGHGMTWKCHQLEMTLDGLIQREETGDLFILERKTYGNRPNQGYLMTDDQYTGYLWGTRQAGLLTYGAAYDGAWKRATPSSRNVMEDLFLRLVIVHSDAEIARYGEYLSVIAFEMAACYQAPFDSPINYPDHRWEGCWDCDLTNNEANGICDAMDRRDTVMADFLFKTEYTKRANKGRELVWPGQLPTEVKGEPS